MILYLINQRQIAFGHICLKVRITLQLDMCFLLHKILLRQHDNENNNDNWKNPLKRASK